MFEGSLQRTDFQTFMFIWSVWEHTITAKADMFFEEVL